MYTLDLVQKVIEAFPEATLVPLPEKFVRDPAPQIKVSPSRLHELCQLLRDDPRFLFDLPNHMTAVDYIKDDMFELVYFLYSTKNKFGVVVKAQISRQHPEIDSISDLWPGMNFQEREVFDLLGIRFHNHPNLKRIFLWEGFPGNPLRKDYIHVTDRFDSGLEIGTPGFDEKGLPFEGTRHAQ